MKPIFVFLIFLLFFSKNYSQIIIERAVITKNSGNADPNFDNARRFESSLDIKNMDYINPEQVYSKIFIFIGDNKVFYQECYPSEKVKLINHSIRDSNFERILKKETFTFKIQKKSLILKNTKNNSELILRIDKSGEYVKLINEKTKDIYIALEKKISEK
ncbi:hypothetical protein REB14_23025 [Chryseobacterium sp. ES2]|uniref:AMIN domain-containing protein n=1 Tax=Chryseobacterium metallicongregator TaxID=3073042 RepID=A0ABU1ECF8_9FLAO|nr:hypothetical protein [Chryseobacterium sp. ES2]MDR4955067.1 hypothetical protein [Chryseobacterium sp. ES2]